jgi:hypothetical protein
VLVRLGPIVLHSRRGNAVVTRARRRKSATGVRRPARIWLTIITIIGKSGVAQYLSLTSTFIMLPDLYISRFRGSGARSLPNRETRQRRDDCVTTTQESYRQAGATPYCPAAPSHVCLQHLVRFPAGDHCPWRRRR